MRNGKNALFGVLLLSFMSVAATAQTTYSGAPALTLAETILVGAQRRHRLHQVSWHRRRRQRLQKRWHGLWRRH